MRWLLGGILVVLAVLTVAVGVLIYLIPATAIERHILTAASRATQSEITTSGTPEITLFPSMEMILRDVRIRPLSAPRTAVTARRVEAEVSWLSLLTLWTIDITKLRVIEPVVQLSEPADADLERAPTTVLRKPSYPMPGLAIREASIERGRIGGLGENWRIKNVDAEVKSVGLDRPLDVDLTMFLNGHKVAGAVKLKDPAKLLRGAPVPLAAKLGAELGNVQLDGTWDSAEAILEALVKVKTKDLDAAARWLGFGSVSEFAGKPVGLDGRLRLRPDAILIKDAVVQVDAMTARISGRAEKQAEGFVARDITIADFDPKHLGLPERTDLKALTVRVERIEPGAPVNAELMFSYNGQPVSGRATLPELERVKPGQHMPVEGRLAVPGGQLEFDGEIAWPAAASDLERATKWAASGKLGFKTDSLRKTARWLRIPLPEAGAFHAAKLDGVVEAQGQSVRIENVRATIDESVATGGVSIDLSGERTAIVGELNINAIDTKRYFGSSEVAPAVSIAPSAQLESTAANAPYEVALLPLKPSLEAYLADASGPQPAALTPALGAVWSRASLGIEALRENRSDIDMDLSIDDLRHGGIALGKTSLKAKLDNGNLELVVREAQPLQGRLSGAVKIDTSADRPVFNLAVEVNAVPLEQVLRQVNQRDIVRGTLTGEAQLSASGQSEADLIDTLAGNVRGQVRNGVIVGYDVRQMVRPFASRPYNPRHTTPFDTLKAEFDIAEGVARSPSIALDGPAVSIRANGTANLRTTAIDYRSKLSLVPPPSNFSLPLKILGTWHQIKAALDWARLATQWTGPSPFAELESARRTKIRDPELRLLVNELIAKQGGTALPPRGAALLRELSGKKP
ncbi:MAG: AsmA-like C-terminal region-containing protein [Filomicrobium sp.]